MTRSISMFAAVAAVVVAATTGMRNQRFSPRSSAPGLTLRGRPGMATGVFRTLLMQDPDRKSKMLRARASLRKPERFGASVRLRLMVALMVCMGFASSAKIALAAGAADSQTWMKPVPTLQIFTFLFLMLGPFKVIGPFAKLTERAEPRLASSIAVRATLVSSLALVLAGVLGQSTLSKYGIPLPDLALAGPDSVSRRASRHPCAVRAVVRARRRDCRPDIRHGDNAACLADDRVALRRRGPDHIPCP